MDNKTIRPSGWYYGLAALMPVLGCLMAMVMAYQWFPGLPGTWQAKMSLENLTQVVVPGSQDITFAESGAYAVYYEYHSVVDGVVYASSETPPALACTLTAKATGVEVGAVPDYVRTNTYSTRDRERVGVLIRSITIDERGPYTFSLPLRGRQVGTEDRVGRRAKLYVGILGYRGEIGRHVGRGRGRVVRFSLDRAGHCRCDCGQTAPVETSSRGWIASGKCGRTRLHISPSGGRK